MGLKLGCTGNHEAAQIPQEGVSLTSIHHIPSCTLTPLLHWARSPLLHSLDSGLAWMLWTIAYVEVMCQDWGWPLGGLAFSVSSMPKPWDACEKSQLVFWKERPCARALRCSMCDLPPPTTFCLSSSATCKALTCVGEPQGYPGLLLIRLASLVFFLRVSEWRRWSGYPLGTSSELHSAVGSKALAFSICLSTLSDFST